MSTTGHFLRKTGRAIAMLSVLCTWMAARVSPALDLSQLACFAFPLNSRQLDVCRQHPSFMTVLPQVEVVFKSECEWQFRKDRWNCTGVTPPILGEPGLAEHRELAFIHALASAITAHQITQECSYGSLNNCSCDTSRNGETSLQGWMWGSCSDNISYGVTFAQKFLDARETEGTLDHSDIQKVGKAIVHLHNNGVGRRIVQDNMKRHCRCTGLSGSCSTEICWLELPTIFEIGDILRQKYENAIPVEVNIPQYGGPASLRYENTETGQHLTPPNDELVYLVPSKDCCSVEPEFTRGRYCIGQGNMTVLNEMHLPPCEELCCNGQFSSRLVTVTYLCNCSFIWCCSINCEMCSEMVTEYQCTS